MNPKKKKKTKKIIREVTLFSINPNTWALLTCSTAADVLASAFEILVRAFVAYFSTGKRKSKKSKDDRCGFHAEHADCKFKLMETVSWTRNIRTLLWRLYMEYIYIINQHSLSIALHPIHHYRYHYNYKIKSSLSNAVTPSSS